MTDIISVNYPPYSRFGNIVFCIAAAWAHAKRNNLRLVLTPYQKICWDGFLHKFKEQIVDSVEICLPRWNEPHYAHHPIPKESRYIAGYYQSAKYFADFDTDLRKLFYLPQEQAQKANRRVETILNGTDRRSAIAIHVRLTDYLHPHVAPIHAVCTPKYHIRAMAAVRLAKPDAVFFVFSDDIEQCRRQPHFRDCQFVDEPDPDQTLYIMSQMSGIIGANSSFSWWAAWLQNKPTMAWFPIPWFGAGGRTDTDDVYYPGWNKISAVD